MSDRQQITTDVAVIGGGLAGLIAADALVAEGHDVLVLEGRDRVGGRIHTIDVGGVAVDAGATWVGTHHSSMRELTQRLGIGLTPQHAEGESVVFGGGERLARDAATSDPAVEQDMERILSALTELADALPAARAWEHPDAPQHDRITFLGWLQEMHASATTMQFMEVVSLVQWGAPPSDISFFNVLRYLRTLGGLGIMLATRGGAQQDRVVGSAHAIPQRLAELLGPRVRVGDPVHAVTTSDRGVRVATGAVDVEARFVVVAMPPSQAGRLDYTPPLPERHRGMMRSWRMGALSKAFVAYERPFWRDEGLSGQSVFDSAMFLTFDVSPANAERGVLMAFCDSRAFDAVDADERQALVVDHLAGVFGERARDVIDYQDFAWGNDSFAPGGPNPAVAPTVWTSFGRALAEPVGRIHWASSEHADLSSGSMDGAVRSGQSAAQAVSARLARDV